MSHKICKYCNKPIILNPSATERAKKYGGKPKDYIDLFTSHSACLIAERNRQSSELMLSKQKYV
jgi:hypothetical protein